MKRSLSLLLGLLLFALPFLAVAEAGMDAFGSHALQAPFADAPDVADTTEPVAVGQCLAFESVANPAPLTVEVPEVALIAPAPLKSARESSPQPAEPLWLTLADSEKWRTGICSSV